MLLEALELRDHDLARWERTPVLAWGSARRENLNKSRVRGCCFARIIGNGFDQVVDHFPGAFDALGRDATTIGITQQVATSLREQRRIGGFGCTDDREEKKSGSGDSNS